jgi:NADH dehydrogenase FAD-containing subunit
MLQSTDRLLSDKWPIKLSQKLERDLMEMGAEIVYGERVDKDVLDKKAGAIHLKNGQTIEADLIFNTAGTKANSQLISAQVASAVDSHGFVKVDETLKVRPLCSCCACPAATLADC